MKNKILLLLLLIFVCKVVHAQNQSINFMGKNITFGSSTSDFLVANSDYQLYNGGKLFEGIKVYHKNIEGTTENGSNYWFRIYFKFYNDKLFEMEFNEYWTPKEYIKAIQNLINQFNIVKEESNDDEGGWYKQYLEKDNLSGIYTGGGEGSVFTCNGTNILKEVLKNYPNYGK